MATVIYLNFSVRISRKNYGLKAFSVILTA